MSSRSHGKVNKKRKRIIITLSGMLSAMISLCVALILVCALFKGGLFSEQLFRQTLSESSYYDNKIENIKNSVNARLSEAGLPNQITDSVLSNTVITVDVNKIISGKNSTATDISEFENQLNDDIIEYLQEENVPVTDNIKMAVSRLADEIAKSYDTQMTMSFARLYREFREKYSLGLDIAMYVSIVMVLVCIIILICIHSKRYRGLRYVGYGILAGSIVSEIFSIIMKNVVIASIPDKGTEYYDVMIKFAGKSFELGIYMSLAGIFAFCLVVMVTTYFKKRGI